ncbi:MAG: low molecular weight protein-tyrosine-phosphatase [Akkermansiaceae bacterium]|nr:low molecular weight protein-tyrosine-phosphatase [Akkermansiaceae bacterium]
MDRPQRILFVCMGNICRSPAAEIIFRKLVCEAGLEEAFEIDSAGTIGYHAGNPPDSRMTEALRDRGYEVCGRSRQIVAGDLEQFDRILTMDEDNLADVLSLSEDPEHRAKVQGIIDHLQQLQSENIPDPYYGGQKGFERVIELLEDACQGLLDSLKSER